MSRALRNPFRTLTLLSLVALVGLGAGACREDGADDAPAATVTMGEFWYKPADVTVEKDSKVRIVNDGAVVHTWIVKGPGVGTVGIAPGKSVVLDLSGVQPGTYQVYCDQAGHSQAGQTGRLTIT